MLFPDPEGPTIAVEVPDLIVKLPFSSTGPVPSGAVGYLNLISSNLIPFPISMFYTVSLFSFLLPISGSLSITSKISFEHIPILASEGNTGIS